MRIRTLVLVFFFVISGCSKKLNNTGSSLALAETGASTFSNPLLSSGPDPWVFQKDSTYYYTHTLGNHIAIYKTNKISELSKATISTIWSPPVNTA